MTGRVLVVFAGGSGCTETIAEQVAAGLRAAGATVALAPAWQRPDPVDHDAVVAGTGVRLGRWHPSARRWLIGHACALSERPLALFTVGLTLHTDQGRIDEVRNYTNRLLSRTGLSPVDHGLFTGWNLPDRCGPVDRSPPRGTMPIGDSRDLAAVRAWGRELLPRLRPATTAAGWALVQPRRAAVRPRSQSS